MGPTNESIQRGIVSNEIGLKNAIARKSNKASTIKSSTSHRAGSTATFVRSFFPWEYTLDKSKVSIEYAYTYISDRD